MHTESRNEGTDGRTFVLSCEWTHPVLFAWRLQHDEDDDNDNDNDDVEFKNKSEEHKHRTPGIYAVTSTGGKIYLDFINFQLLLRFSHLFY